MTRAEALRVLGLKEGASRAEVMVAYRELAQMLHPDKFDDNPKLRARAEGQMRAINEARDVLVGKSGVRTAAGTGRSTSASATRGASTPEEIRFEAEARAHAAETARLTVVAHLRTMRERRRSMLTLAAVAAVVALVCSRMRGMLGTLVFSIASMLVVWGVVDVFSLSSNIRVLEARVRELTRTRDQAQRLAREAAEL